MKVTLKAKITLCLAEAVGWTKPESILTRVPEPTRRAINKALQGLLTRGIVDREYDRPKKYDAVKWKGLADSQKSKISRNSQWRIKSDKRGITQAFNLLWKEGEQNAVQEFINSSSYCQKNYLNFPYWRILASRIVVRRAPGWPATAVRSSLAGHSPT